MKIIVVFILTVSTLCSTVAFAQKAKFQEILAQINNKLEGNPKVSMKKEFLYVQFTKDGTLYRQDKVLVEELNGDAIEYLAEEKAIVLRCKEKAERCFYRQLYLKKRKNYYNRLSIKVEGKESTAPGLIEDFKEFIKLWQD